MCLKIIDKPKNADSKIRRIVYKVFTLVPNGRMLNPYWHVSVDTEYFFNKSSVSNRESAKITDFEKNTRRVINGFHCFLNIERAKQEINSWGKSRLRAVDGESIRCTYCICECEVSPQNHVADGLFEDCPACVYHRITPVKKVFQAEKGHFNDTTYMFGFSFV